LRNKVGFEPNRFHVSFGCNDSRGFLPFSTALDRSLQQACDTGAGTFRTLKLKTACLATPRID